MEGNGPDLSKILKMVTENPAMIQTALSFLGKMKDSPPPPASTPKTDDEAPKSMAGAIAPANKSVTDLREDERRLLLALRPYLNETRREKIDFILKILQLLQLAGSLGLTFDAKMKGE